MTTTATINTTTLLAPPLALYVHFPWCARKCPYCDFNSHELKNTLPERDYIGALVRELDQHLPLIWGRPIRSIFMGGGTPSLFSAAALDQLFGQLRARLTILPSAEITLEANPGTFEQQRFGEYRALGINRLSIGIQSFDPAQLQQLGRIHDHHQAIHAVATARQAGFDNFNLDLMYGLPGQDPNAALADITQAIDLDPPHISHYQLSIEPNTAFAHRPPRLPADVTVSEIETACRTQLQQAGYTHYEISAFARPGRQCAHNLNYWQFGDYLGLGAGAHSKLTQAAQQQISRQWNVKHPREYQQLAGTAQATAGQQTLSWSDCVLEFMMNNLRLHDGFSPTLFTERTGLPLQLLQAQLQQAQSRGLLCVDADRIYPTARGRNFLNDLLTIFT
ncbi:MAG: oxygen-independent coproporphyrinogen III oxidase-like protein [Gammaproteobacteria bacterium]|nr:oxygen-independent coproporphyrinogen III oxidase-like protein [Gammaproteobacteria bacterium]